MKVIKQLFTTFYQSLGYLKRGNIIGAYYWFYVRNCVSLCGNKVHRFTEGNDKKSLVQIQRGFHELPKLQKVNARLLKDLFLDSTGFAGSSMDDYFNECRLLGYVRPNGIDISENSFIRDVAMIIELVQGAIYRDLELEHSTHKFMEEFVAMVVNPDSSVETDVDFNTITNLVDLLKDNDDDPEIS